MPAVAVLLGSLMFPVILTSPTASILTLSVSSVRKTGSGNWSLLGNADTTAEDNFLGTTDSTDLVFRTNNIERMTIDTSGNVGIGTTDPQAKLVVNGEGQPIFLLFDSVNGGVMAWIGANPPATGDGRGFAGLVDETSIYNRALSGAEIQAIVFANGAGKCKHDGMDRG